MNRMNQFSSKIELAFLSKSSFDLMGLRDQVIASVCDSTYPVQLFSLEKDALVNISNLMIDVLNGNHVALIRSDSFGSFKLENLFDDIENSIHKQHETVSLAEYPNLIQSKVIDQIISAESEFLETVACLTLLVIGITYAELFLQMNYSGPEIIFDQQMSFFIDNCKYYPSFLALLECDGVYTFPHIQIPMCLVLARTILATISQPSYKLWQYGVSLDTNGKISLKYNDSNSALAIIETICSRLISRNWLGARIAVVHLRCLQKQSYSDVSTLWNECQMNFTKAITVDYNDIALQAQLWVEWGLCYHFFQFGDKGKDSFKRACDEAGLKTVVTGALGLRTKYQQTPYAQLILIVTSNLSSSSTHETTHVKNDSKNIRFMKEKPNDNIGTEGWQHGEWELGRRLVGEVEGDATGQEAAVREVMLDSIDGGAQENILLEGGPKYTEDIDIGSTSLHPVDQAIILALCLDVSNSNPMDGLTSEEMFPYLQRVLQEAQNWMIHSTALLERSWLEFEKRRTFDRALLQIQALLDQHTTKLTIMQSTYKAIEESAPVQDRLRYIHSIVYPAQYELKRDLAHRYLKAQVFLSALNLFKELQMWDEVVKCYQLLEKPQRAEMVVREQLKNGETPYMLTALADITSDEMLYERAWEISNGRYARAKRTLGRLCYDRGDFINCIKHLNQALAVHPLIATAWYLRGIAAMQLQDWSIALESFIRCIQQDMEIGEAYANMGAIFMRQKEFSKALSSLQEALKLKRDSWKILENLLTVCLPLRRWKDAVYYMDLLLDLRSKSQRPVHKDELRYLVRVAADISQGSTENEEMQSHSKSFVNVLEVFLKKLTNSIQVDHEIWDIMATFYESFGRLREALDTRFKEIRSAFQGIGWEKDFKKIEDISSISCKVVSFISLQKEVNPKLVTKSDIYTCKSLLQSIIAKLDEEFYQVIAEPDSSQGAGDTHRALQEKIGPQYSALKQQVLQIQALSS